MLDEFHPRYVAKVEALINRHTTELANGFKSKGKIRKFHGNAVKTFRATLEAHIAGLHSEIKQHSETEGQRIREGIAADTPKELGPLQNVYDRIMKTHRTYVIKA